MLFEPGFLGTRALVFMDIVTIFFAILPFLVFGAIRFAIKGNYRAHFLSQTVIFSLTLLMVVVFEVGVRLNGGFAAFSEESAVPFTFLTLFLIVHILIALATVLGWMTLIYKASRTFTYTGTASPYFESHKKNGRMVFTGICITSLMGCMIYAFLFIF